MTDIPAPRAPWQCPGCGGGHAPWVDHCGCHVRIEVVGEPVVMFRDPPPLRVADGPDGTFRTSTPAEHPWADSGIEDGA